MVRARRLRHKVTVQSSTDTKDSYGDPIPTWATYCIRDADINPVAGNEYFTSQQRYSENSIVFRIRFDSVTKSITPKMRISYDSRTFDIEAVVNVKERNRDIDVVCIEVT